MKSLYFITAIAASAICTAAATSSTLDRITPSHHRRAPLTQDKSLPPQNRIDFLEALYLDPREGNRKQRRSAGRKKKHFNHSNPSTRK